MRYRCFVRYFTSTSSLTSQLEPYIPPSWISKNIDKKYIPDYRLHLIRHETSIEEWHLPQIEKKIYIKRDDTIDELGCGNKLRKLEFIFAEILKRNCSHIITAGSLQSNHCKAVASVAARLGIKTHLLLRTDMNQLDSDQLLKTEFVQGNVLLNWLFGSELYLIPKKAQIKTDIQPRMEQLAKEIKMKTKEDAHLVSIGGSDPIGLFGYMSCFTELEPYLDKLNIEHIVLPLSSGGTMEGLSLASYFTGRYKYLKIHAFAVSDNRRVFYEHFQNILEQINLHQQLNVENLVDICDQYVGLGYGRMTNEQTQFIKQIASKTGIILDPVYTGKCLWGLIEELKVNPKRFDGGNILFLHTGGILGLMNPTYGEQWTYTKMDENYEFLIPPEHAKIFAKALQVLTKMGDEIYVELVKPGGLSFRTSNSSRSSYACFAFHRQFFYEWPKDISKSSIRCRVSAKRCLSAVHAISSSKSLTRLILVFDDKKSVLSFILHCRYDIVKTHTLFYIECETLQAVFSKQSYKNSVSILSKTIQDIINNFPTKWDEITIKATQDKIVFKNSMENDDENQHRMSIQMACEPNEFCTYEIEQPSEITFCLKELRFFLTMADAINIPLTLLFDKKGRPIIFCFESDEYFFDGTFVFATIAGDENDETSGNNRTDKKRNNSTVSSSTITTINRTGIIPRIQQQTRLRSPPPPAVTPFSQSSSTPDLSQTRLPTHKLFAAYQQRIAEGDTSIFTLDRSMAQTQPCTTTKILAVDSDED
ncbi:unnamed protein product [Didymodactylos carnosus]|uniref:Cell cycle checkpoint control protein RAD9A n=1 Tax=Didymodactylos carnosus TaxID=1234261 RepID=A0A814EF75_9BILA|nr:unnamed protein product [Didymodactylos carnosus]CAF0970167.1 unnamed protein product [Didymodactylos carnosus]CAF3722920.1 unnamed protein product [Didymodactylos carnosus]CAF3743295.1 unnamed protein product [Didymodactylos carnosus]